MRSKLILLGWIIGILFPFGWLARYSDVYRRAFDTVFGPLWVHIVMHAMLYAVLVYLLAGLLLRAGSPTIRRHPLSLALVLVLVIALGQESFQLFYLGRLPGADEWLDIGVDLAGGLLGLVAFRLRGRRIARQPVAHR
ncbi:MAG: VanZ family protein [Chloroflexota bacterium]